MGSPWIKDMRLKNGSAGAKAGHLKSTFDFWDELFASENLLGIFTGHFHRQYVDVVNGIPQFVSAANAMGAFTDISFVQVK